LHPNGKPSNVKGIAVSIPLNSIYVNTLETLERIDLWWNVVDCKTGGIIKKISGFKRSHNTIYGRAGDVVYLDDIGSHWLYIADARKQELAGKVGLFANNVRPFTVNGKEDRVYVTVDSLLGFEVGDLRLGTKIAHVEVEGWEPGPVRRHGDPSHGIGLTPDEKELWVCDGRNMRLHVFSAVAPYQQLTTIPLQDMPGWIIVWAARRWWRFSLRARRRYGPGISLELGE
jgi:hypothetical protein